MKVNKTIEVAAKPAIPAHKREVLDKTICDVCGINLEDDRDNSYSVVGVTMEKKTGDSFPEGGSGKNYYFDICVSCWDKHIVPFMSNSLGAKVQMEEWDF